MNGLRMKMHIPLATAFFETHLVTLLGGMTVMSVLITRCT